MKEHEGVKELIRLKNHKSSFVLLHSFMLLHVCL